jgi:hypothetical protein
MQNHGDTPLISEFLHKLKAELLCDRMNPSDAALAAARMGRLFFTESHLGVLSRELLGYSEDQAEAEMEVIRMIDSAKGPHTTLRSLARHRLVAGFRMPLFVALRQAREGSLPRVKHEQWFCGLSASEIEDLLRQLETSGAPYIVLDWSNNENGLFICSVNRLRALRDGMKDLIVWCIDLLIKQLRQLDSDSLERSEAEQTEPSV